MKNKTVKALAILLAITTVSMMGTAGVMASDNTAEDTATEAAADDADDADDAEAADDVALLSDKTEDTATEAAADDAEAADDTAEASDDDQAAADNVAAPVSYTHLTLPTICSV